ncbi:MAG: dockerin type I domain-containing protein [Pirellulaceae bacterium]
MAFHKSLKLPKLLPRKDLRLMARRALKLESLEERRLLASLPFGAAEADLGEFMLGRVAVTPVLLESNGQIDQSTEDWTNQQILSTLADISVGLDWWVDTLDSLNTVHELEFQVDTTYAMTPAETSYEPIARRSNDYALYVSEFLAGAGFTTGNLERDIQAFNQSQREKLGTDWSFTIFVVPSVNDADGQFAAGGSFSRAFAFAGGLFMIVPSTRPASTYTHETGHMFWARDEYVGGGSYFSYRGYYNTQNLNAADNPNSGFVQQPSIMAASTLLQTAYDNHISPASTLAMIGWQDSDGDGIFDVLDVPHRLTGDGYLDNATGNYRFIGSATVQTLPNLNSSGLKNDVTINKIREIEYRVDGGAWQIHSLPDAYEVDLDLTIPIPSGAQEIEIRARDSKSTVTSNVFLGRLERSDSTLVPGINGYAWIDSNGNTLRDVGEFGEAGWSVTLIDANGTPLDLRKVIEPDSYPDGVLLSGFSPDLTLSSVGSDVDGRVAVFNDTGSSTSTGTKNFRAFSTGSQSFVSTWNSSTRRLQADFAAPTSTVSIDAIGAFSNTYARLEAYNSSGQLLGRYTTGRLDAGDVETMTIERGAADIAYVIVGGHAGTSIKLDNLQFGPEATRLTGLNGRYNFPGLPTGEYTVRLTPNAGFRALDPVSGTQTVSVTANTAAMDIDFGFEEATSEWQNPRDPLDVNDDMIISAVDVLLIINEINARGARDLRGSGISAPPFVDVTGESFVSGIDVLQVINYINAHGNNTGEGEVVNPATIHVGGGFCSALPAAEGEFSVPPIDGYFASDNDDEDELLDLLAASSL